MGDPIFYVDGDLRPESEATVSVQDRGFKYGDAAFETLRAYGGDPFEWDRHAERLTRTCDLLGFDHGFEASELRAIVDDTLSANDFADAYVRLSVTRGVHTGKLAPPSDPDPTVVVLVSELPRGGRDGTEVWDAPATAELVERVRISDESLPSAAKTHNYLQGVLARREADADEALMLDSEGFLTEGATSNLFFVADGALKTPSLEGPILPGITREVVLELAEAEDIPVETGRYTAEDLRRADEAFLTNSTWEVRPLSRVGETEFGVGPITERLVEAFDARVEERHY
ncbi:aminotransferase class IV [Halorussus lipolyticus]|uniref:aminotransferase class IV n=1 Tax=Halorussus lipolyticus TaxID=3034024 RepID=UPI0023E870DF|nr:aminotransferase class IV [Halorussus sp. DT80]